MPQLADDDFDRAAGRSGGFNQALLKHLLAGAAVGFVGVLVLTSVLYETATSSTFAVFNAIALFLIGCSMVVSHCQQEARGAPLMTVIVMGGAVVTFVAALGTCMVRFAKFGPIIDVVFLVSASGGNCYALSYVCVDVFNSAVLRRRSFYAKQLYLIAAAAVLVGTVAGLFFAAADVEDHVRRLGWEQWLCAGVGAVAGAGIGWANHNAVDRSMLISFDALPMDNDVDDDEA